MTKVIPEEIELALLAGAIRCAWGDGSLGDKRVLSMAVAQCQPLIGKPAYKLALAGSVWLNNPLGGGFDTLSNAICEYCHLRFPPAEDDAPSEEPPPENPSPAEPEPEEPMPGRPWERDHGLIG